MGADLTGGLLADFTIELCETCWWPWETDDMANRRTSLRLEEGAELKRLYKDLESAIRRSTSFCGIQVWRPKPS
jgi:hypothetical protein